jgi:hypothetical protein
MMARQSPVMGMGRLLMYGVWFMLATVRRRPDCRKAGPSGTPAAAALRVAALRVAAKRQSGGTALCQSVGGVSSLFQGCAGNGCFGLQNAVGGVRDM